MSPLRSQGRAVLAVSSGLFGGFTAFALQRASGSTDPRVLYPLLALGTGIGIGAALLVADEWDVTTGDAGYLSAGAAWGAAAGFLIAAGQNVEPFGDRYGWGIGGGLAGLGLATLALTRTTMDDGDATLAHSGGALGLLLGGATEFLYRGSTTATPYTGMGYGTAIGLVGAGLLTATQVRLSPSRALLIDVGAGGGALLGAAAASPLIFQNQTEGNTRGWLSATVGGSLVGGLLAWWLTHDAPLRSAPDGSAAAWLEQGTPTAGVLGMSQSRRGSSPVIGVRLVRGSCRQNPRAPRMLALRGCEGRRPPGPSGFSWQHVSPRCRRSSGLPFGRCRALGRQRRRGRGRGSWRGCFHDRCERRRRWLVAARCDQRWCDGGRVAELHLVSDSRACPRPPRAGRTWPSKLPRVQRARRHLLNPVPSTSTRRILPRNAHAVARCRGT